VDREPSGAGRDFLDSAERRKMAGLAGEVSASFDLLATVAGLGGARRLAEGLAGVSERVETPASTGSESFLDGSFAPAKKGSAES